MKLWYVVSMILALILSIVGCGAPSESADLDNYLTEVSPLIEEIWDISSDLIETAVEAGPFELTKITETLATYSDKYQDLLNRFKAVEYPEEAVNHRKYTIDIINNNKQMVDELTAYVDTRDISHLHKAKSYATDSEELRPIVADEWAKLRDMAGE